VARNASTAAVVSAIVSAVVLAVEEVTSRAAAATVAVDSSEVEVEEEVEEVEVEEEEPVAVAPAAQPVRRSPLTSNMLVPRRSFGRRGRLVVSVFFVMTTTVGTVAMWSL